MTAGIRFGGFRPPRIHERKTMLRATLALLAAAALASCATAPTAPPAAVADLAPTGKLRAVINFGNPILAKKDAATGEATGVSVDLARELARRLGVEAELVTVTSAGQSVEVLASGRVDVGFFAIDPARAATTAYTGPYVQIEGAYLVRNESPIRANEEVDREGIRVAVGNKSAYDLYLGRNLRNARGRRLLHRQQARRRGGREAAARDGREAHSGPQAPAGALHGHQPGHGHGARQGSRCLVPHVVRRGDEVLGFRGRGARPPQDRGGGRGTPRRNSLSPGHAALLGDLVRSRTAAALGTLHEGAPFVSMVPFAVLPDGDAFVVHVSRLAAHTKDMAGDPRVSLLVMQPEGGGTAAQALARVSIQGEAKEMEKGSAGERACREAYLARFPEAAPLTEFGDFSFFAIRPSQARFVAGFAQAMSVTGETLAKTLRGR
jgi:hypothetical protein